MYALESGFIRIVLCKKCLKNCGVIGGWKTWHCICEILITTYIRWYAKKLLLIFSRKILRVGWVAVYMSCKMKEKNHLVVNKMWSRVILFFLSLKNKFDD